MSMPLTIFLIACMLAIAMYASHWSIFLFAGCVFIFHKFLEYEADEN